MRTVSGKGKGSKSTCNNVNGTRRGNESRGTRCRLLMLSFSGRRVLLIPSRISASRARDNRVRILLCIRVLVRFNDRLVLVLINDHLVLVRFSDRLVLVHINDHLVLVHINDRLVLVHINDHLVLVDHHHSALVLTNVNQVLVHINAIQALVAHQALTHIKDN